MGIFRLFMDEEISSRGITSDGLGVSMLVVLSLLHYSLREVA